MVKSNAAETKVEAVSRELMARDEALRVLKFHLLRAQGQMKKYADLKIRHLQLFQDIMGLSRS